MKRYFFIGMALLGVVWAAEAPAGAVPRMIISVENNERHIHTIAVRRFADEIAQRLTDRMDVQFFSDARLYRDKDVVQALEQGKVEMAVPGTWHVSQFEPDVGVFMLPFFYGRPAAANYRALDGRVGKMINDRLQKNRQIKILGRWLDLGHAHLFGISKKISRHEDIKGLRVRIAGGAANKLRMDALGARPLIVAWPDLPEYMERGRVDAVLTSYATIQSAGLWEKGIKYVFEDREYFPQYIPMVRLSFWNKLSPEVRKILSETWEKHIEASRNEAAEEQAAAKSNLIRNGVEVVVPDPQQIEKWRKILMQRQPEFVREMHLDPAVVREMDKDF